MLNETQVASLLEHLIPSYETATLEALDARDEYLALTATHGGFDPLVAEARQRWEELERTRDSIGQSLDEVGDRKVA